MYQDAFEICNPLGSARSKYKVVGIYMTVANMYPWHRFKVDDIKLVALCYESQIKRYGFDSIFNTIVSDLKRLENEGIKVSGSIIKGTLIAFVGDNLGSHQIGGFIESFNTTNYFCRYCYCSDGCINMQYNTRTQLRTKVSHISDVDTALSLNELYRGVKYDSVLNTLKYYHVCSPGLPPCLAHDMYEGVVQSDVMLIINELVKQKMFTYESLNSAIKKLAFLKEKSVQVPPIRKAERLLGTANQNLWLLNILPFVVYNQVNTSSEHWKMLLLLRQVSGIILGFRISVAQIAILRNRLFEYIEYRQKLFPNISLKPKHHFILHYPLLIKMFGPLRHLWTLCFESKHSYFKNVVRHSPNFKNMLLSLANKHQLLENLHNLSESLYNDAVIVSDAQVCNNDDFSEEIKKCISLCPFENPKFIAKLITFRGTIYSSGMMVCFNELDYETFEMCEIQYILINQNFTEIYFVGQGKIITYSRDKGLYFQIQRNDTVFVGISYDQLLTHETVLQCSMNDEVSYYFKSSPLRTLDYCK